LNALRKENDMNPSQDPVRLRGLLGRDSTLGQGIEAARSSRPSDEELKALERRVLAGIGVSVATAAAVQGAKGARRAATWFSGGTTKLVLALTVAAAVGGGAVVIGHKMNQAGSHQDATLTPAPAVDRAAPEIRPSTQAAARPAPAEVAAPVVDVAHEPAAGKARPAARAHGHSAVAAASDDEIPLLERAHRALSGSPAVALRLATEHARRFPSSSLDQERELIAVTALVDLGRTAEARRLARRFADQHPGSAYVGRIENILREHP
jgi:hypothetical protein